MNNSNEWRPFREQIQRALVESISELDELFADKDYDAGCTVTICIVVRPMALSVPTYGHNTLSLPGSLRCIEDVHANCPGRHIYCV